MIVLRIILLLIVWWTAERVEGPACLTTGVNDPPPDTTEDRRETTPVTISKVDPNELGGEWGQARNLEPTRTVTERKGNSGAIDRRVSLVDRTSPAGVRPETTNTPTTEGRPKRRRTAQMDESRILLGCGSEFNVYSHAYFP